MKIHSFKTLLNYAKNKENCIQKMKISLLADSASQFLGQSLVGRAAIDNIDIDLYEASYNQIEMELSDPNSGTFQHNPDFLIINYSAENLRDMFWNLSVENKSRFAQNFIKTLKLKITNIRNNVKIILNSIPLISDGIYGHFEASTEDSFDYQLAEINLEIRKLAIKYSQVFIMNLQRIQANVGLSARIDQRFLIKSKMTLSLSILPQIAESYWGIISAIQGSKLKKCLILDLDNTIWGGVIGDDGIEGIQLGDIGIGLAFTNLQKYAKALKQRGIILCVCSKNTESIAKAAFVEHPNMILNLDDIVLFVANWENKADNIRYIKKVLNIGYDSMVFLDDNPFERNLVRQELPKVCVPELPDDPVGYLPYIISLNLFETASVSVADNNRTSQYKEEAERVSIQSNFTSLDDYLENLDMKAEVGPFNKFSIARIAQLTQRSNQFNLRTIRYSAGEIEEIVNNKEYRSIQIRLRDKFGDYGIISSVILKIDGNEFFIETWIMSCRVLKRGVEYVMLDKIIELANSAGIERVVGEYLETKKNVIVKDLYKSLGFLDENDNWVLDVKNYQKKNKFISLN